MAKVIDARGLACPQPVINTKKALEEIGEGIITVMVNSVVSRDNVRRFAESQGCTVEIEEKEGGYSLHIAKGFVCETEFQSKEARKHDSIVVYVNSDMMGIGDEKLGRILLKAFFKTLVEPKTLIFINSGVKLTTEGSEVIEEIKELEKRGIEVLSCGTCLDFYGLNEKLQVGIVSNMYDIVNYLMEANKVISP
ncbi:MAG: sulfurtransferase-like selenium metabolism protein YedF [Pseudomonadota bacterium]